MPLCCDNTGEDLWIIFCCFIWLYGFIISFFCLCMKAVLSTAETSAALWMFAYAFIFAVIMTVFGITANKVAKQGPPAQDVEKPKVAETALRFRVEGHCNKPEELTDGIEEKARQICLERAEAVIDAMELAGTKRGNLTPKGCGYENLVADHLGPNSQDNMRVVICCDDAETKTKVLHFLAENEQYRTNFADAGAPTVSFENDAFVHGPVTFEPNSAVLTDTSDGPIVGMVKVIALLEKASS